jgi:hypothetical protein
MDSPEPRYRSCTALSHELVKTDVQPSEEAARPIKKERPRKVFKYSAESQLEGFAVQHSEPVRTKTPSSERTKT